MQHFIARVLYRHWDFIYKKLRPSICISGSALTSFLHARRHAVTTSKWPLYFRTPTRAHAYRSHYFMSRITDIDESWLLRYIKRRRRSISSRAMDDDMLEPLLTGMRQQKCRSKKRYFSIRRRRLPHNTRFITLGLLIVSIDAVAHILGDDAGGQVRWWITLYIYLLRRRMIASIRPQVKIITSDTFEARPYSRLSSKLRWAPIWLLIISFDASATHVMAISKKYWWTFYRYSLAPYFCY